MVDMSLEKLLQYEGISPEPADFWDYWERALLLLESQTMDYTLERDEFSPHGVECYHLYFTGVGGARIHSKFLKPEGVQGKIPGLVMFHGYQGNCGDWFDKLPFVYNGMAVAAMDVRGQGGTSQDTLTVIGNTVRGHIIRGVDEVDPEKLAYRLIYLDTVQLVRILMSMNFIDETRIGATGASQGGGLTLACTALEPHIKIAAPQCPFLCDYRRVWELGLIQPGTAYEEIQRYLKFQDPLHSTAERLWERLGYIDVKNFAPRIKAKVVFFTGLMDETCPPSTQFSAYNRITSEKELVIFPDWGHEAYPLCNDIILQHMMEL